MTCVVGLSAPGKGTVVAFDSLAGSNGRISVRRDLKGAMQALTSATTLSQRQIARKALEAAAVWTPYVRSPWHFLETRA